MYFHVNFLLPVNVNTCYFYFILPNKRKLVCNSLFKLFYLKRRKAERCYMESLSSRSMPFSQINEYLFDFEKCTSINFHFLTTRCSNQESWLKNDQQNVIRAPFTGIDGLPIIRFNLLPLPLLFF